MVNRRRKERKWVDAEEEVEGAGATSQGGGQTASRAIGRGLEFRHYVLLL